MPLLRALFLLPLVALAQIPPPPGTTPTEQPPVLIEKPPTVPDVPITNQPVAVFSQSGTWGGLPTYNWSVCNTTDQNVSMYGSSIWAQAQRHGLLIMTNAQATEYMLHFNKESGWAILRTALLAGAGVTTAMQSIGVLCKEGQCTGWQKGIAPGVGFILTVTELAVSRHEEKLVRPADYLPASVQIPPGGCEFGQLIGSP